MFIIIVSGVFFLGLIVVPLCIWASHASRLVREYRGLGRQRYLAAFLESYSPKKGAVYYVVGGSLKGVWWLENGALSDAIEEDIEKRGILIGGVSDVLFPNSTVRSLVGYSVIRVNTFAFKREKVDEQ